MLNSAFDGVGAKPGDYYPAALRGEIDAINARIYDTVNNGVYKAGFATTQAAYEEAVVPLFDTLDWLDQRLLERGRADTVWGVAESAASRCSAHKTAGARADAAAIDVSRKKWRRDGAELITFFIVQPCDGALPAHQVGT